MTTSAPAAGRRRPGCSAPSRWPPRRPTRSSSGPSATCTARSPSGCTASPGAPPAGPPRRRAGPRPGVVGDLRRHRRRPPGDQPRAARGRPPRPRRPHRRHPPGPALVSAVNGLIGDRLAEEQSELAIEIAVRRHGRDVPRRPGRARRGVPGRDRRRGGVPARARRDRGGVEPPARRDRRQLRRPAGGGHDLDAGLPARQHRAADRGERRRAGLAARPPGGPLASRRTPDGAGRPLDGRAGDAGRVRGGDRRRHPLEHARDRRRHARHPAPRGTAGARCRTRAKALGRLPESAPFGRILEYRSVGILDLRPGSPPTCRTCRTRSTTWSRPHWPARPGTRSARRSATCSSATPPRPAARDAAREMFPGADVLHIKGDHFDLLNHPDVYAALTGWLG